MLLTVIIAYLQPDSPVLALFCFCAIGVVAARKKNAVAQENYLLSTQNRLL